VDARPHEPGARSQGAWSAPEDELVVEAEEPSIEGDLADEGALGPSSWRAPAPATLPENPLLPPPRELTLDPRGIAEPPREEPEFAKMRLGQRQPGIDRDPKPAPGRPPRATAYDRRRPVGRTRWHQIFEPNEEDFRRRIQRKEAFGAAEGAGLFALIAMSLTSFGLAGVLGSALPGALAGFVAVRFAQDSAQGWALACLLSASAFAFAGSGPFLAVLMGAAGGLGWLVGMTREWRMTVDS